MELIKALKIKVVNLHLLMLASTKKLPNRSLLEINKLFLAKSVSKTPLYETIKQT
jgi:hypothetical protein